MAFSLAQRLQKLRRCELVASAHTCLFLPCRVQERLYYAALKSPPPSHNILASTPRRSKSDAPSAKKQIHFFNIDNELVYWNFFLDFGPLNLGQLARFTKKLQDKLRKFPVVCFYSNTAPGKRANAIFLICAYQLLYLDRTPEEAFRGFDKQIQAHMKVGSKPPVSVSQGGVTIQELPPFHDASPCQCTYDLTVLDCLRGMAKARSLGFYDPEDFDVDEYEHFEQVEVRFSAAYWSLAASYVLGLTSDSLLHSTLCSPERRFELDRQGQDLGLCGSIL